jgi:hypothetical protein
LEKWLRRKFMVSIAPKEKFTNCRLCHNLVGSDNPICKTCGLEMSSEGIIELATIEEQENLGFDRIYDLKVLSIFSLLSTILGYLFTLLFQSMEVNITFFFKLYFWVGFLGYLPVYINWHQKHSKKRYSVEDAELIKSQKKQSLLIFSLSVALGAFIYIFLLK